MRPGFLVSGFTLSACGWTRQKGKSGRPVVKSWDLKCEMTPNPVNPAILSKKMRTGLRAVRSEK